MSSNLVLLVQEITSRNLLFVTFAKVRIRVSGVNGPFRGHSTRRNGDFSGTDNGLEMGLHKVPSLLRRAGARLRLSYFFMN